MAEQPKVKRERPRDELGRPLSWDSVNLLRIEDFGPLPDGEVARLAIEHFDAGRYFQAHEAWETLWKRAKGRPDEEFYKGLSQLGAGYVHWRRGNPHGTKTLLRRASRRIRPYGPVHAGIDCAALAEAADRDAAAVEAAGGAMPELSPPAIPTPPS